MKPVIFDKDFSVLTREIKFTTCVIHDKTIRNEITSLLVQRIPDMSELITSLIDEDIDANYEWPYEYSDISMGDCKWILGVFQEWAKDTHVKLRSCKSLSKGICECEIDNRKYYFELFIGFAKYPELRKFTLYITGWRADEVTL